MAGVAAGGEIQQAPATKNLGRRRAAGIYGAIITAAILDAAGGNLPTAVLVISVVFTLLVYWLAEEYAEVLGEQVEGGRLPSRACIGEALAATWPMVTVLRAAARTGAGPAGRGLCPHGRQRWAGRGDCPADNPWLAGWPA
ncbi:MAG: hypothetical protein ACXVA6_18895, partial [Isosphaeraceae bacterium]